MRWGPRELQAPCDFRDSTLVGGSRGGKAPLKLFDSEHFKPK